MSQFVKVASAPQIHENCGIVIHCNGLDIALFKRNGEYFAINNICAHQHFSMLHKGKLDGLTVECPMHGWIYDLQTGLSTTGQGKVARYRVRVDGDDVLVEIPEL
ncbi:MAG: Rieske 2Fe-2S domain-containing protein [Ignavibacteria bacterium]|nr:Rieske 2Fe-2S domain-containing protein [Ignavibacteria bacterium]